MRKALDLFCYVFLSAITLYFVDWIVDELAR